MCLKMSVILSTFLKAMKPELNIGLILIGFFVALFSVGSGIGGGTLFVSAFVSLFKYDFKSAAGRSQAAIIPITLIGSISHFMFFHEIPPFKYYILFIPMCMLGAIIGCRIINKRKGIWLRFAFSCFLLIAGLRMVNLFDIPALMFSSLYETTEISKFLFITSFGIIVGISATLLGIGCGLMIVPFFVIVMNFNIHEAIRLSLTTMLFLTVTATVMRSSLHTLKCHSLKSLIISSLLGAVIGAIISNSLPSFFLKHVFGIFLLLIACSYITGLLFQIFRPNNHKEESIPYRLEGKPDDSQQYIR